MNMTIRLSQLLVQFPDGVADAIEIDLAHLPHGFATSI
jgi:hypothetical protein